MFFPCYFLKEIASGNTSKHLLPVTILFSRREVNDFLTELRHSRDERLPSPFFFYEPSHLLDVTNKIRRSSHSLGLWLGKPKERAAGRNVRDVLLYVGHACHWSYPISVRIAACECGRRGGSEQFDHRRASSGSSVAFDHRRASSGSSVAPDNFVLPLKKHGGPIRGRMGQRMTSAKPPIRHPDPPSVIRPGWWPRRGSPRSLRVNVLAGPPPWPASERRENKRKVGEELQ